MHIVSQKSINEAKAKYPEAAAGLEHWYKTMRVSSFQSFSQLRSAFASVDKVEHLFVFNIGGNKLRLIASIHFNSGKVFIRQILTHTEYDRNDWKRQEGLQ